MILSLFVYTFMAFCLYQLADSARKKYGSVGKNTSLTRSEYIVSFLLFAFVVGARYRVGVDHLSYLDYFNSIRMDLPQTTKNLEPLFYAITWLFAKSGLHYFFYFAFWGFLQLYFIYYAFKDSRFVIPFAAIYIILGPIFFDWMNIMRQSVAVCAFAALSYYIAKRKIYPFICSILILSLIHKSAILCLPLYFISYIPEFYNKRRQMQIIFGASVFIGISIPSIHFLPLQEVMNLIGYDNYNIEMTMSEDHSFSSAWGPRRLSMLVVDFAIIYFFPTICKKYNLAQKWNLFFTFFFIGACLYNVVSGISGFLVRPLNYLLIFRIPLVGLILYYTSQKKPLAFLLLLLCACTFTYIGVYTGSHNPSDHAAESCLYKFFFFEN